MNDHTEFPWGPQYEPGLLTPLGIIGWAVASALLLLLILRLWNGGGVKTSQAVLDHIYKVIRAAAKHAAQQSYFAGPAAAHLLCDTIRKQLGGVMALGAGLNAQLEAIEEALGIAPAHGHGAHGGGHGGGHGGHGAGDHGGGHVAQTHNQHTAHQGHAAQANDVPGAVANTVQGHSITVNLGSRGAVGELEPPLAGTAPTTLPEQLVLIERLLREFEGWWANKPVRMGELHAAQKTLTTKTPPDPALVAVIEEATRNRPGGRH